MTTFQQGSVSKKSAGTLTKRSLSDAPPILSTKTGEFLLLSLFQTFKSKNLWPSGSSDLNSMDFSVWGTLGSRISGHSDTTAEGLRVAV
ncbi:unnamed protein product [Nippostrongylus brasiliensis]|uniref:Uncharacterized protein n=1 Tax=Nippostrongylus brasiliensis TaxID=27835 RepID=A0A3P7BU59_NIPBR|nr:unnamed protein product [Nippostrongylus brasiliensis]